MTQGESSASLTSRIHSTTEEEKTPLTNCECFSSSVVPAKVPCPRLTSIDEAFLPFVRFDDRKRWSLFRRVRFCVILVTIVPIRLLFLMIGTLLVSLLALILSACLGTTMTNAFSNDSELFERKLSCFEEWIVQSIGAVTRFITGLLGLHTKRIPLSYADITEYYTLPSNVSRSERLRANRAKCNAVTTVCNHFGYIDILILLGQSKSFLAHEFIRNVPFIGRIAGALNSLFTDHTRSDTLSNRMRFAYESHKAKEEESSMGCQGCVLCSLPLAVFCESTTTNNASLLPFRRGAFLAGVPVKPLIFMSEHRVWNPSWESKEFLTHALISLAQWKIEISVYELPVYFPNEREQKDPLHYASNVCRLIAAVSGLPIHLSNRHCKVDGYHALLQGFIDENQALEKFTECFERDSVIQYYAQTLGSDNSSSLTRSFSLK